VLLRMINNERHKAQGARRRERLNKTWRMALSAWRREILSSFYFCLEPCALSPAPRIRCYSERSDGSQSADCRPPASDFRVRFRNVASAFVCLLVFSFSSQALAKSPSGLVKDGNSAYNSGQYDKAISAYDEALKEASESPYVYFDKGAALYKKGDYAGAGEAFEKAASKSKDQLLEAKSKFNLGNSNYKQAGALKEKEPDKALEKCSTSISHYREALNLDPKLKEAAENIEMVRLDMKNILDLINKQKDARKDEQEKKQETAKQLQKLIKDQEAGLEKNQKLDTQRAGKGDTPKTTKEMSDLSKEQKALRDRTDGVLKDLQKAGDKTDSTKEDPAVKHLENAEKEQDAASGNLDQKNTKASLDNQKKAVKELKDALDTMQEKGNNNKGQNNAGQQDKQAGTEENNKGQQQASSADQSQSMTGSNNLSGDARDILNDEKTEKDEQRKALAVKSYKEVDKDW
jgi:Ca-activated chloride channel homolog